MSERRGLEQVDGLLVSVVAVLGLLAVAVVFLLREGGTVGAPGGMGPQLLGFTLTILVVIVWLTLSRR